MRKYSLMIALILTATLVFTACNNKPASPTESSKSQSSVTESASSETATQPTKPESETNPEPEADSDTPSDSVSDSRSREANPYYDLDFSFVSEDIYGNPVTSDIFKNADLTLLNIFATWCPPCVEEMPHLSALNEEFKEEGFQVIGFCTDLRTGEYGELDQTAIATAKDLFTGVNSSYPYIIPDETFLGGILFVQYFPTTVFLDKNGRMLGEPVVGANSYEGWKEEITKRLEDLR